jgi:hypothetical protein
LVYVTAFGKIYYFISLLVLLTVELLYLIFAVPLLFTGAGGGVFGNRVNGNGNGNGGGGIVTEDPCC